MRLPKTTILLAICIASINTYGCKDAMGDANTPQAENGTENVSDKISLSVELIADSNGGKLVHGRNGVIKLNIMNVSKDRLEIPLFIYSGKGRSVLEPSYMHDVQYYTGFRKAILTYGFYKDNKLIRNGNFSLPEEIELKPEGKIGIITSIDPPDLPGNYKMIITFNTLSLKEAHCSYNDDIGKFVFVEKSCIVNDIRVE